MRRAHNPSLANRRRKHPLDAQADRDWQCGMAVMLAAILCAFLVSLPSMSRARFDVSNEHEREPVENAKTAQSFEKNEKTKGK